MSDSGTEALKKHVAELKSTYETIKDISIFSAEENAVFQRKYEEIERQTLINNSVVSKYTDLHQDNPDTFEAVNMAIGVANENCQILGTKHELNKLFIQDLYQRIKLLGDATTSLIRLNVQLCQKLQQSEESHG